MVKFKVADELRYDMLTHFALAERIAKEISDTFPGCITLEFEKCYMPYCLYSKKRCAPTSGTEFAPSHSHTPLHTHQIRGLDVYET